MKSRSRRLKRPTLHALESRLLLSTAMPAFESVEPAGSMAYRSTAHGIADAAPGAVTGPFTFQGTQGQALAVSVEPFAGNSLDVALDLRDPSGNLIASADARGSGGPEVSAPVVAPVTGEYSVTVRPVGGSSGTFRVDVLLNAAIESEGAGLPQNDNPATATDINGSFNDIGGGAGRGAAVGGIADAVVVNGASEDFQSGVLGPAFTTRVTGSATGIDLTEPLYNNPNKVLWLHGDYDRATGGLVEVVWTVSLSGASDVNLSFTAVEAFNDFSPFPGDFVGHSNADGVAISDNGVNWHPVLSLPDTAGFYKDYTIDLDAEAAKAGMRLNGAFQIKFQYYDDYTFGSSGAAFDDLKITRPDEDWYAFSATAGDHLSLQTDIDGGVLELYDTQGHLLGVAQAAPGASRGVAMQDVDAASTGTYRARVVAPGSTQYGLSVYRNASLNLAPHHLGDTAQDLRETSRVAGVASANLGRLFGSRQSSYPSLRGLVEIDRKSGVMTRIGTGDLGSFTDITTTPNGLLSARYDAARQVELVEFDPDTAAVLRTIPLGASNDPGGVTYFDGELFLANGRVLDYATGAFRRQIEAPGAAVTATATNLLGIGLIGNAYQLFEIDPQTGTKTGFGETIPIPSNGQQAEALASVGNDLYVRVSGSIRIYVVDLVSQRILRSFDSQYTSDFSIIGELGADGGPAGNGFYTIPVRGGDTLTLSTTTPPAGNAPGNGGAAALDPVLELYSPTGQLIATNDNGAPDGRNALLTYTATQTGDYKVRLRAANGAGAFVLTATGYTGASPELSVTGADPANGATLTPAPQTITLDFSAPIAPASVQAADLTVDGRPATGFTLVDADTVRFNVPVTEHGRHVVRVAAGAIADAAGTGVQEFFTEFNVAQVAPRVVATSLPQGAEQLPGPLSLDVRFDRPIAAAGLDVSDFALVARDTGVVATPSAWSYDAATMTLHASYASVTGDQYSFLVYSGNGRFEGEDGGDLDGEGAGMPSGDGAPGGTFVLNFALQQPNATAAPSNLVAYPISEHEVELVWRDNSSNERGFRVDRAVGEGDFVKVADLPANSTRYNDTSATNGAYYRYRVRAFVVAGPSAWSNDFISTVLPPELTTPVKRFPALPELSTPLDADPTVVVPVAGGAGVFAAKDYAAGNLQTYHAEFWRTDGTPESTTLLKDIGTTGYQALGATNGLAIFAIGLGTGETTIWRSDGTEAGTVPVKNLGVIPPIVNPRVSDGLLYFNTVNAGNFVFYRTDGTADGTITVTENIPPVPDEYGQQLVVDGVFYGFDQRGLYKRVGPPGSGDVVIKAVQPGGSIYRLTAVAGKVAFVEEEWETHPDNTMDLHEDLYVTDGSPEGTVRLAGFTNIGNFGMSRLVPVGSSLYFTFNSGGSAVWRSDLTPESTHLVMTVGGQAKNLAPLGDLLTFSGGPALQVWATDGTAAGTRRISNVGAVIQPAHPDWMTDVNGTVFFISSGRYTSGEWTSGYGEELWKTDGTPEGTVRLFRGLVHDLVAYNGALYFAGGRPQGGFELWKSDGTAGGTVRVKDVQPNNTAVNLRLLDVANGRLFFAASRGLDYYGTDYVLWSTDGTEAGTTKATDVPMYVDITSMAPNALGVFAAAGNYLYFRQFDGGDVRTGQLWRTDGTPAGTTRVGTAFDPRSLTNLDETLYFIASNPSTVSGEALYKVAAGAAQPTLVKSFHNFDYRLVEDLTRVGNRLFFSAPTTNRLMALWKSDGTASGTTAVRTVPNSTAEPYSARVMYLTDVDGTAYFVMTDAPDGMDGIVGGLWKSDGTSAGTVKVRDFAAKVYDAPIFLTAVAGKLVYSDGTDLWRSNGTRGGTVQIERLSDPSVPEFFPFLFDGPAYTVVGDQIYFSAAVPGGDPRARELRVASLTTPDAPSDLIVVDQPPEPPPPEGASPAGLPRGVAFGIAGLDPAGVKLTWRDNSANESGFVIERSRTSDFAVPDRTFFSPANTTSFVDNTGTPGTVYYYRVRAVNAGGDSDPTAGTVKSASVAARHVFYNHSAFDGDDAGLGTADDAAIASDKLAWLVGPLAVLPDARYVTGYSRGINGVMVDITGLAPGNALSAGDFLFEVGNGSAWSAAPAPTGMLVRRGAGTAGSDRVSFAFADNAIRNTWLRVTILANAHTGLARPDVFYFGNLVGDTGDAGTPFRVNALDLGAIKKALNGTSTVTGRYDVNKDGRVNALDLGVVKANLNRSLASLGVPIGGAALTPVAGASGSLSLTGSAASSLLQSSDRDVLS